MAALDVTIECCSEGTVFGVTGQSNDRTISRDITALSEKYHLAVGRPQNTVLPFYVMSMDYDEQTRGFRLFIGGEIENTGLEKLVLPMGEYAKITVRPKLGFIWGAAVGKAKRYFYTKWLQESEYSALNMEYEYHTQNSIGRLPTVDVIFAVKKREG